MHKKTLFILLMTSILFFIAACSGGQTVSNDKQEEENVTETQENEQEVNATRTIKHLKGEREIPANPERVIVLSHVSWEGSLLSVGVKPIAAVTFDGEFAPHLADELAGVHPLEYATEPELEEILQLNPDLLIVSDRFDKVYEQLEKIAPTVMIEVGGDWKEDHLKICEAVGKLEEGHKVIEELSEKAKAAREQLAEKVADKTVLSVAINRDNIRVYGRTNHAMNALLYDDLQLTPPEGIPYDFGENISVEGLSAFNPDFIIDSTYFNSGEYYDSVVEGNVWNSLEAVKNGHVYTLTNIWGFWDPIERSKGIDEIVALFEGE